MCSVIIMLINVYILISSLNVCHTYIVRQHIHRTQKAGTFVISDPSCVARGASESDFGLLSSQTIWWLGDTWPKVAVLPVFCDTYRHSRLVGGHW